MMSASSPTPTISHRPTMTKSTTVLLTTATIFCLGVIARHNLRWDISSHPLRQSASSANYELLDTTGPLTRLNTKDTSQQTVQHNDNEYFVFLQKFPLQNTWQMIFHTEVVVCPRSAFDDADFLSTLDQMTEKLSANNKQDNDNDTTNQVSFLQVPEEHWVQQTSSKCVQLGYGGATCEMSCCGTPHGTDNTNYALSSRQAVIGNAMGDAKQLYLYGVSNSVSGMDAYRAVCVDNKTSAQMPTCVSHWAGTDYNPLTNNCNTFTSTILKCVYGLSDAKPNLGISDMVNVACPMEKRDDGMDVPQCLIPVPPTSLSDKAAADELNTERVE